jgi:hypothetical protein
MGILWVGQGIALRGVADLEFFTIQKRAFFVEDGWWVRALVAPHDTSLVRLSIHSCPVLMLFAVKLAVVVVVLVVVVVVVAPSFNSESLPAQPRLRKIFSHRSHKRSLIHFTTSQHFREEHTHITSLPQLYNADTYRRYSSLDR